MRYANDCAYLARGVRDLSSNLSTKDSELKTKMEECADKLDIVAESWMEDMVVSDVFFFLSFFACFLCTEGARH